MSKDLLLELETADPVAGNLDNIRHFLPVVVREVGWAVEGMKGSAQLFETVWRRLFMDVAKGQTTEVQAARPHLVNAFEKRFRQLQETHTLATWLANLGRPTVPSPDILLPEIDGMKRLKAVVFDRWQTPDDLEDLAARDYPLTTADLDRIGPNT